MPGFENVELYVLLTASLCKRDWFHTAEDALTGGARALQLREKQLSDRELLERAKRLRELCSSHGALLIINDRPDVALASRAHGVHLGQDDMSVSEARGILGDEFVIGLSTHTIEQARAALAHPPDYLAVGPMFASITKPCTRIAGPQTLNAVRQLTALPLAAIGGINADNAADLRAADTLAVCSAAISAPNVGGAVARILQAKTTARRTA